MRKKRVKLKILVVALSLILVVTFFRIYQIQVNADANLIKFEQCLEDGKTAVYEKSNHIWDLSEVWCEEN